jgi:hypothetical protein
MTQLDPRKIAYGVGPGFAADLSPLRVLKNLGYQVETFCLNHGLREIPSALLASAGIVILRGPWMPTPEDAILTRLMASRLPAAWAEGQRVYGFGRGAWMLAERCVSGLVWQEAFVGQGPWLESQLDASPDRFFSLVQGQALPQIPALIDGFATTPWIRSAGTVNGWQIRQGERVCFTDPLSFSDRSQLRNFGYENLEHVRPLDEVLKLVLRES